MDKFTSYMTYEDLDEDVQLSLKIAYFTYLKKNSSSRDVIRELIPDVSNLYYRIVLKPYKCEEVQSHQREIYLNFLQDMKFALMSYDETGQIVDGIYDAIAIIRQKGTEPSKKDICTLPSSTNEKSNMFGVEHQEISEPVISSRKDIEDEITPSQTIVLTHEIIESARTPNGGFTKSQLAAIGIPWPKPTDWIEQVVGKRITKEQLDEFKQVRYLKMPSTNTNRNGKFDIPDPMKETKTTTSKRQEHWTFIQEKELIRYYRAGMTILQLALYFEKKEETVTKKLKSLGLL